MLALAKWIQITLHKRWVISPPIQIGSIPNSQISIHIFPSSKRFFRNTLLFFFFFLTLQFRDRAACMIPPNKRFKMQGMSYFWDISGILSHLGKLMKSLSVNKGIYWNANVSHGRNNIIFLDTSTKTITVWSSLGLKIMRSLAEEKKRLFWCFS